ncbi:amidohydrolase [Oceaniovalibus sp. ACAM 378]|uniref:amidohydrolase family protein n=1 Tax=Oceaniovalibus sp. ACAM 378 TaxID=2599923 RepID=UPI0011DADDFB|nr:amidohydrolase [Oceaniovalibus sp. ACAM 378]TYB85755.1 amidohydrolase family protein [Oceaniovalibus sp. ACAM 378]
MDLIDTHQHLILRDKLGYGWTKDIPALAGNFTPTDYAALVQGRGVVGTIFMETGVDAADYQREARLVAGMIGQAGDGPVLLGQIAACHPEIDDGFEAWLEECRDLGVVGLRRILHRMPDDTSTDANYRRNMRRIGAAGWPVDLCFATRQLDIAADLVRACPEVNFILDHCGTNDMQAGEFDAWRARMGRLAALPNLQVKFSGMTAYVPADAGPHDPVAAVANAVLELFGPARLIWGGDWPVVDLGVGLPGWIDLSAQFLAPLSADERARIGHANARAFYNLSA